MTRTWPFYVLLGTTLISSFVVTIPDSSALADDAPSEQPSEALFEALRHQDQQIRRSAYMRLNRLTQIDLASYASTALEVLRHDNKATVSDLTLHFPTLLAKLNEDRSALLSSFLEVADDETLEMWRRLAAYKGASRIVRIIDKTTTDAEFKQRFAEFVRVADRLVCSEADAAERLYIVWELGGMLHDSPTVVTALKELLDNDDVEVRLAAAARLAQTKNQDPEIIQAVAQLVEHGNAEVRESAIAVLRDFGAAAQPALPQLERALAIQTAIEGSQELILFEAIQAIRGKDANRQELSRQAEDELMVRRLRPAVVEIHGVLPEGSKAQLLRVLDPEIGSIVTIDRADEGPRYGYRRTPLQRRTKVVTGVVVDDGTTIVTSESYIAGLESMEVVIRESSESSPVKLPVESISRHAASGLAVLRVGASDQVAPIELADSEQSGVGDEVKILSSYKSRDLAAMDYQIASADGATRDGGPRWWIERPRPESSLTATYPDSVTELYQRYPVGPAIDQQGRLVGMSVGGQPDGRGLIVPTNRIREVVAELARTTARERK